MSENQKQDTITEGKIRNFISQLTLKMEISNKDWEDVTYSKVPRRQHALQTNHMQIAHTAHSENNSLKTPKMSQDNNI